MQQQEDNYSVLFDKNPLPMIVIEKETFKFLKVNAATIKIFAYSEEEMLDKTFMDIVPDDERGFLKEELKKVNADKDVHLLTKNIKKNGEEIDVELIAIEINYRNKPCILKIATDITEKKKSDEVIKKLNIYLKELFHSAPFAIVLSDEHEHIVNVNPAFEETFKYSYKDVKEKDLREVLISEEFAEEHEDIIHKVRNGEFTRLKTKRKRKDNELIDVLTVKFPIVVDKEFLGSYSIYIDISSEVKTINELNELYNTLERRVKERTMELESAYQRADEINKIKDRFISMISHDFRNPIAAIVSSSEILMKDSEVLNAKEISQFSAIINRSSKKIVEQLNELVEWSIQKTRKIDYNPRVLNLSEFVSFSLELIIPNADQKGIQIYNDIDPVISVNADPLLLRSIIQNLVTNAIKFTPEKGKITLAASIKNKIHVEVSVADTGIGMTEEIRSKILSDEYLLLKSSERRESSGLGLALVKDFVEKHKGEIRLESVPGKGTTFYFTLPLGE